MKELERFHRYNLPWVGLLPLVWESSSLASQLIARVKVNFSVKRSEGIVDLQDNLHTLERKMLLGFRISCADIPRGPQLIGCASKHTEQRACRNPRERHHIEWEPGMEGLRQSYYDFESGAVDNTPLLPETFGLSLPGEVWRS